MDSFKIILTLEKNKTFFSAIPHNWEKNNYVYWPSKLPHNKRESLRCNAKSQPENDWLKYKCTVKCSNISSFKEALQIEKQFCDCSDTESEQIIFAENKSKEIHHVINRNDMFEKPNEIDSATPELSQICLNNDHSTPVVVEKLGTNGELFLIANDGIKDNQSDISKMKTEMEVLQQDVKQIKEQQIKININLEKILNILTNKQHEDVTATVEENKGLSTLFKLPLESVDEVDRLDKELRNNENFKSFLIRELSKIGGTQGTDDGIKVGYKITDQIFHPEILMEYTWTGVSRNQSQAKKPFNSLQGICDLYYHTIILADNRHTLKKNESLFKAGVLKHAKKRTQRKRLKVNQKGDDADGEPQNIDNIVSKNNIEVSLDSAYERHPQLDVQIPLELCSD